ncbi:hypothetical protein [Thalassotalea fusca]
MQLPIQISATTSLQQAFKPLNRVLLTTEAQLNFQSMTAGWYGDEDNILNIQITLQNTQEFSEQVQREYLNEIVTLYADDVQSVATQDKLAFYIYIAVTEKEQVLFTQHHKLIEKICQTKIRKVINLIASDLSLPLLP